MRNFKWHRFLFQIICFISPFIKYIMGYNCNKEKGPFVPTIILANHNTDLDPALVAFGFSRYIYYLASEHVFRKGFLSKLLIFSFAPVPINKTKTDISAITDMLRRIRAGFNFCFFPEGNRSYDGITGNVPPSTAKLVKSSKADLITYHLEGGYFVTPRWAKNKRKGKISGKVMNHYSALELQAMTTEEVMSAIERDLYENAYERQKENPVRYRGKDLAEHIEIVLYICPKCKRIGTIYSKGNHFYCDCGLTAMYTETCFLEGEDLPFSTISDWNEWQKDYLSVIIKNAGDKPICIDDNQNLFVVQAAMSSTLLAEGPMQMTCTELLCAGHVFPLEQITKFAIVDKMTLQFSLKPGNEMYEVRSDTPRSALKYVETLRILRNE